MLGQIFAQCLVHHLGISEDIRKIRLQQHNIRTLAITFVVLPPRTAPVKSISGMSSSISLSFGFIRSSFFRCGRSCRDEPDSFVAIGVSHRDEFT